MRRLYFWFKGATWDRPGGPWWYRDFESFEEMSRFFRDVKPFLLHARWIADKFPEHDPMDIQPPVSAVVMEV